MSGDVLTPFVPTAYLIRHATPDWNRTDLPYYLPPGPPLTAQGEDEARQLGRFLWEAGVRLIYASPLERAWRTAEIAAGIAGASLWQETNLAEWRPEEKADDVRARAWPAWEHASALSQQAGPTAQWCCTRAVNCTSTWRRIKILRSSGCVPVYSSSLVST